MSDPLIGLLKHHEHRTNVQQMISTMLFGLITEELNALNPGVHSRFHQILDSSEAAVAGNEVACEAIAAIRTMLG